VEKQSAVGITDGRQLFVLFGSRPQLTIFCGFSLLGFSSSFCLI